MKKILIFLLACMLCVGANAQQNQPQLSETELRNAQTQILKAVENLKSYIERLGNSEAAGGASPEERTRILKYIKRVFFDWPNRYVSVTSRSHPNGRRVKAENYFFNLSRQASAKDGYIRIYRVETDEVMLSKRIMNVKNYNLVSHKNGLKVYRIRLPFHQVFIRTNDRYDERTSKSHTQVDRDNKMVDVYILIDDYDDGVICKLGNVTIKK